MAIEFQYAVIVYLLERFQLGWFQTRMMSIEYGTDRVVIIYLRRSITIDQDTTTTIQQTSEYCGIATRLSEVKISQLKHGRHILL